MPRQITNQIMMVRPANFGYNAETAANNAFQTAAKKAEVEEIKAAAQNEFDAFVEKLRQAGVLVKVVQDTLEPVKFDAVFPNNWISFHQDGTLVTYPMFSPIRRAERREDVLEDFENTFQVNTIKRYEHFEDQNLFLEGTGSMILDRENRIAYACLGSRTDLRLFKKWGEDMNYRIEAFHALDAKGKDIYHTNVMMALGRDFVVICMNTITNPVEQASIKNSFRKTGKTVIEITQDQVNQFAGNMLQVSNSEDEGILVMSEQAFKSLNESQISLIESKTKILHAPLYTIEKYGGGSARCMMAEVFLTPR